MTYVRLRKMLADQRGVTLAELLIVILMTGMMVTIIAGFTINFWRYGYMLEADLDTLSTRLNSGDFLRSAISPSTGLIVQNSIADSYPLNADPGDSTGTFWQTIHAVPGNVAMAAPGTTTPLVYYSRPSIATTGDHIKNGVQYYEDEYILYLDGTTKTLRQRALANPNVPDNRLKTSCPETVATVACPADKVIATDVASIDMRYFSRTGNTIDYHSSQDPTTGDFTGPDFTAVEVIEFSLNLSKKPFSQTTTATKE